MDSSSQLLGFDIPVAVLSGVAALWAGALVMNDKRYARRHILTMLSGLAFLVATILELVADGQIGYYTESFYQMNSVSVFFAMIARYLLWCILFEVARTTCDNTICNIPKLAYGWGAIMSVFMLLYVILTTVTSTFASVVFYYIGTYGIVVMNILQWVLSARPGYSLGINPFRASFRVFALILSLVSLGMVLGNVSIYVYSSSGYIALGILQYVLSSLLASLALVMACVFSSKWVSFNDHDRLNQVNDDDESRQPMGTYNPDDVYTSNKTAADDVGHF
ncbi:hypothetical protein K492DRAFT_178857 [Lichtheimia hyalospora FSU 10163]|nr:hypothetical protein K492DRAFT_178857 [Lichtheimia hyalospora FSU 10163]